MPKPPADLLTDFEREALYTRDAWFVHDVLDIDPDAGQLTAQMHTDDLLLVSAQREVAGHAKHVPAAIAIQATGTLGQLYAVYVLGLRATEGWAGYGTHIHKARWGKAGRIGPPITLLCTCTRQRTLWSTRFVDFTFRFEQEGDVVYSSRQTAAWKRDEA